VKRSVQLGRLTGPAAKTARQHGLLKVNPNLSFKAAFQDAVGVLPSVGVGLGAAAAVGWAGGWVDSKVQTSGMPDFVKKWAKPGSTALLAMVAYMGARMNKTLSKHSVPILVGGMTVAFLQVLRKIMVGEVSVADKLGLGEYVAIGAAGDHGIFRGSSIGAARPHPELLVDGAELRLNGMGDYVAEPGVGEYVAIGDFSQMGYGREGKRGYASIPTAEEILDAEGGVLSGSIFDDH
jgi:hypothetical protein